MSRATHEASKLAGRLWERQRLSRYSQTRRGSSVFRANHDDCRGPDQVGAKAMPSRWLYGSSYISPARVLRTMYVIGLWLLPIQCGWLLMAAGALAQAQNSPATSPTLAPADRARWGITKSALRVARSRIWSFGSARIDRRPSIPAPSNAVA
jgi:hypothetical protein